MKKLKSISIATLILNIISTIWSIGVLCYYVDNLLIRAISVFILMIASTVVSNLVGVVLKNQGKVDSNL